MNSAEKLSSIDVIIVNWNAGGQLADVINSIALYHTGLIASVVIVDNASTDNSLVLVEEQATDYLFSLNIIRNQENRGFGAACNQGAALAKSELILFLNPDTRLFENSLSLPYAFLADSENKNVGIVGIQLADEHNLIARSCARFPKLSILAAQALGMNLLPGLRHLNTHMTDWAHDETREVDHVMGAFYLIRRSIFESLGGFDERFFLYLEDLDLSLRARQAGWRSVYLTGVQAFHAFGGTSRQIKAHRLFYSLRSRLLYGFKHFTPWQAWALFGGTLILEPVSRSVFSLLRGGIQDVRNTWSGFAMLYCELPKIIRGAHLTSDYKNLVPKKND